jgi:hypothetical protein
MGDLRVGFVKPLKSERGAVVVWVSVLLIAILGVSAIVIDVGRIDALRAQMQRACDAAALAGAKQLPYEDMARAKALDLAAANGFTDGEEGVDVTCVRNPDGNHSGWYQVQISKPINYFFAPVLGYFNGVLSMHGTASYISMLPLSISSSLGTYGTNGIMNLSVFGPYGYYTYGDAYSTKWLDNGNINPNYTDHGYDFAVKIPDDYVARNGTSMVKFEIFDPGCWNVGDAQDAGSGKVDEIRTAPPSPHQQPSSKYTTTRYQLFAPSSTPNDFSDDILIAEFSMGKDGTATDVKWLCQSGWTVDLVTYGTGDYRINVKSTNGSSENGFNLRAGPPRADGVPFNPYNGTEITATGRLPINFNVSGTVDIDLGFIPPEAAGYDVYINKFDTDVGSQSVTYYDDYGHSWPGTLAGNGTYKLDKITIPDNFPGGRIHAQYVAGAQDTSSWEMYFDGKYCDGRSELKLVD